MRITIFGASGKVGRQVVKLALDQGYEVRAFVHSHDPFSKHQKLTVVKGDVSDHSAVAKALSGSQTVICALGSWGTKDKNVLSRGMKTILPIMEEQGIQRIVTLTGAGARWSGDKPGLLDKASHAVMGMVAGKILGDSEEHLLLLEASKCDWTCLRSPVMTSGKSTKYRLSLAVPPAWATVSRISVAHCLLDLAQETGFSQQAPVIYRG